MRGGDESPIGRDGGDDVEDGEEVASDKTMVDAATAEVVSVNFLPSGKAFEAPSAFADVEADSLRCWGMCSGLTLKP